MSNKTKKIVYCAALTAVAVLLAYLSRVINPFMSLPFLRFSLAPAVVIFAGALLGWGYGALVGGVEDVLTFFVAPPTGPYFPAFTLTMILYGILGGLIFHKKKQTSILRTTLFVLLIQTVLSACLNTMWNVVLYGPLDPVKLGMRLATSYTACVVYIVILNVLFKYKARFFRLAEA